MNDFDKYPEFERDPEYIVGRDIAYFHMCPQPEMDLRVFEFDPWRGLHKLYPSDYQELDEQELEDMEYGHCVTFGWTRLRNCIIEFPVRGSKLLKKYTRVLCSNKRSLGETVEVGKDNNMDLDFELKVEETCFKINKMFLQASSPVFRTILNGDAEAKHVDFSRDLKDYDGTNLSEEYPTLDDEKYLNACSWYLFLRQSVPAYDLHKDYRDLNLWRFEGQRVLAGAVRLAHKYDCPALLARFDRFLATICYPSMEMLERASMYNAKETMDCCIPHCYDKKDALRAPEKLCKYAATEMFRRLHADYQKLLPALKRMDTASRKLDNDVKKLQKYYAEEIREDMEEQKNSRKRSRLST